MKSLIVLWQMVAEESAIRCCTSTTLDLKTVQWRSKKEGSSFLTITLPAFGKDFERGLDQGFVDRHLFQGFTWRGGLPVFLRGFLDRIFDRSDGSLLPQPCVESILAVRQLTLMFGKILIPCSERRVRKAMRGYVECEQEVRAADRDRTEKDISDFRRVSQLLYASAFTKMDRKVYYGELVPKHGPGATADRIRGNGKFRQTTWPARLEEGGFNSAEFLIPNHRYYDELEGVTLLEPGAEIPVRVITVPKTLKTPRIIGIEPTAMQYAQQAVLPVILDAIKDSYVLDSMLGFDDQKPNQLMAQKGSSDGLLATLDLSEASDRVSNQLVRELFRNHPHMLTAVDACRSRKADVDGYGVLRLAKFASMGSALCFPIEAMVFLTVIMIGIERELNEPLTRKHLNALVGQVRVYGDDIVVPVTYVRSVVNTLSHFGAKVNVAKSFWNGSFRESCGREFYAGEDVSIVRVRQEFPTQRMHVSRVISLVSLRNQLYFAGYWQTCKWLDGRIRKIIKHFPVVLPTSCVLGRHSFLGYEAQKQCDKLFRPLVRGWVVSARPPEDNLEGSGALLKCLLRSVDDEACGWGNIPPAELASAVRNNSLPAVDVNHLERAGRPQSVDIKLGWSPPY